VGTMSRQSRDAIGGDDIPKGTMCFANAVSTSIGFE
jgi:hypothetical protein